MGNEKTNNVIVREDAEKRIVTIVFDNGKETAEIITDKLTGEMIYEGQSRTVIKEGRVQLDIDGVVHKISGVCFPPGSNNEVVIFTNSPGCYWYWTGSEYIWRCRQD